MIPEQYWQIVRRWFWIIIALGVLGGVAGLFLLPIGLGGSNSVYDSSTTLGVGRFISFGGTVTAGSGDAGTLLADYTSSIAGMSGTVQFQARLRDVLKEEGLTISDTALPKKLSITADRGLFRINIQATASTARDAEILAQAAADVLTDQVVAEETRIKQGLGANTDEQRTELLRRLSDLNDERVQRLQALDYSTLRTELDNLIRDGGVGTDLTESFRSILGDLAIVAGDAELASINAQADALNEQLAILTRAEESFTVDVSQFGQPVFVVNPVETVATEVEGSLRRRDMLVLGTGAGLIMGWVAANMAEHARNGRSSRPKEEEGEA
jgi:hypothetical protein